LTYYRFINYVMDNIVFQQTRMKILWGWIMFQSCFLLAGCSIQDRLLYYPSQLLPTKNEMAVEQIEYWPDKGSVYRGFVGTAIGHARGTVIVFHGNAGTAADRSYYARALAPLAYRVILAEYPGYCGRPGALWEESFVQDARETLRLVFAQYGKPVYLLGESLGSGVAAALASKEPELIAGILLFTPWDSLAAVAKGKFPWLPVNWLLKDRYDNAVNLQAFPRKIAVIGAQKDEIIPIRHAMNLYQSLPGMKRLWTIAQAGHNDWILRVGIQEWREYLDFLDS